MRTPRRFLTPIAVIAALVLALGAATTALAGGRPLSGALTGAAERPTAGDPDGSGTFTLWLNAGQEEVCFELTAQDIEAPFAAHIHIGFSDQAGPVVVGLGTPVGPLGGPYASSGCVELERSKIQAILVAPHAFYVNVHNPEFPGGALRGQLR